MRIVKEAIAERVAAGESQASIARAAGMHPTQLSNYLRGARDMYVDSLCRLMRVLGLAIVRSRDANRAG